MKVGRVFKIVIAILTAVCFFQTTAVYAYFLRLDKTKQIGIKTGDLNANLPLRLRRYIDITAKSVVFPNGKEEDLRDYLQYVMFENSVPLNIRFLFKDYNFQELKNTVNNIIDNARNFLKKQSGAVVFENPDKVIWKDVDIKNGLTSSQSFVFNYPILTAELSELSYYAPVTVIVTIEQPDGGDISDVSAELLLDKNSFDTQTPFSYKYRYTDEKSWNNNRAWGSVSKESNKLTVLDKISQNSFVTRAYKLGRRGYYLTEFIHSYTFPQFAGEWSRLPEGADLYLAKPSGGPSGRTQQFNAWDKGVREGVILSGRPDGSSVELRLEFSERKALSGKALPYIPFTLIISRAEGVSSDAVYPVVRIKIYKGGIWENI